MGRAWVWALGASVVVFGCGGGAQHTGSGSGGVGNAGSAGTNASSAGTASGSPTGGTAGTASATGGASGAGATSGAGGITATPIPLPDLCPIFTADLCRYLMECDGARYKDAAQCESALDCYGLPQLLDANQKGIVDYDPAKVGACHERFTASPCTFGFFFGVPDIYEVLTFCPGAVTPKQTAGGACSSDGECTAGLYCNKGASFTCPGQCDTPGAANAACGGSVRCAAGLNCSNSLCVPNQKAGDACTTGCDYSVTCPADQICPEDIWCDFTAKVCEPGRGVGEPCGKITNGTTTSYASCAVNLWCDALSFGSGICQKPSDTGGPCNDAPSACKTGLVCDGYDDKVLGTCSSHASAAGMGCAFNDNCADGLACVANVCAPQLNKGGACNSDSTCAAGLVCEGNLCAPALYPGDPCGAQAPCTFSRCVAGTCAAYAKVGEACAANGDCATSQCVAGKCYDSSICRAAPATQ